MMYNIGDFRTAIEIKRPIEVRDDDGYPYNEYQNVFEAGKKIYCRWKNTHGEEIFKALSAGFEQTAKLLIRYTKLVDISCVICKNEEIYDVINIDDINNRHAYIELTVKRRIGGV